MRNIVPRIPGVNTLGTPAKRWGAIYADQIVLPDNKTLLEILSGQDTTIEEVLGQQNLAIANALAAQDTEISNRLGAQDAEIDSRLAAQDALLDEKVDKSGDTFIGNTDNNTIFKMNNDNGSLQLNGGSGTLMSEKKGARLILYGANGDNQDTKGGFELRILNDSVNSALEGKANGDMCWNGHLLITNEEHYGIIASGGASITIDYSKFSSCVIVYGRATNYGGVAVFDYWSGVTQISKPSTNAPAISCSNKVVTFKNNNGVAVNIGVHLYK